MRPPNCISETRGGLVGFGRVTVIIGGPVLMMFVIGIALEQFPMQGGPTGVEPIGGSSLSSATCLGIHRGASICVVNAGVMLDDADVVGS